MSTRIRRGTEVEWRWGSGVASGNVRELHEHRVERTIKGKTIVRNGSPDNPALEIEGTGGGLILKLRSEVDPV